MAVAHARPAVRLPAQLTLQRGRALGTLRTHAWELAVGALSVGWAGLFGWLAVVRHLAGGSHAEDLGFTDQVLHNLLRGQFFRMSIYNGATWNTELDLSRVARPDSLLAFHVEPLLLVLVPLYMLGAGATALLVLQALGLAAGAWPAFRLGVGLSQSRTAGAALAMSYLLSPLSQWQSLSDFHTTALAGPLLLLALERMLVAGKTWQGLLAIGLALAAREDVGPAVVLLGILLAALRPARWGMAAAISTSGALWSLACAWIITAYSGGASPFAARYASSLGAGLPGLLEALQRPLALEYVRTLLLGGGWLGLLAPIGWLPALPSLVANLLSTSPWMTSGKAHYSALVVPGLIAGSALGLAWLRRWPRVLDAACGLLVLTSLAGYLREGSGPLAGNYAPAGLTDRSERLQALATLLPPDASISASASVVPRLTQRPRVYVFPSLADADFALLDLQSSPAPTSAGDVFLRTAALLEQGWTVRAAEDGVLLLARGEAGAPTGGVPRPFEPGPSSQAPALGTLLDGRLSLLQAVLVPAPDGAVDVDGPHWILRTTWRAEQPLPSDTRLDFSINLRDGRRVRIWDVASLWWQPPATWPAGRTVTVDVPDVPVRVFESWSATAVSGAPEPSATPPQ